MKIFNLKVEKITWKDTFKKWLKRFAIFLTVLILFFVFAASAGYAYNQYYANKVFPGVEIDKTDLGGKSFTQVLGLIDNYVEKINGNGIIYIAQRKRMTVYPRIASTSDPDLSREIIAFDAQATARKIYAIGRDKNFIQNLLVRMSLLVKNEKISVSYQVNQDELKNILKDNFSPMENPAQDAKLNVTIQNNQIAKSVEKEQSGTSFDYDKAVAQTLDKINSFSFEPVYLNLALDQPKITLENSKNALSKVEKTLEIFPVKITYEKNEWLIDKNQAARWLAFKYNDASDDIDLGFDKDLVAEYLNNISNKINIEAKEGKFKMEGKRVTEFQASRKGKTLNIDQSFAEIESGFFQDNKNAIALVVDESEPAVEIGSVNDLGIKELVGVGQSDFTGSPVNRRKNIKVGSTSLNGILIKPGEEFSLVKALGEIDEKHGYLPELVIKGNETKPEYGGGLCQIGTTMFRVCLNAGLPITERKPHSYRVVYYEPAGMDATIYSPKPDLKCINDTGNYLLLQTRIDGNNLYFELWGTQDGRTVELTKPILSNITSPPDMKEIKTTDLKVGEKKCTEKSHKGADAVFTRIITKADSKKIEEKWNSHYRPWQAVCLIGATQEEIDAEAKAQEQPPVEQNTDQATNANANTNQSALPSPESVLPDLTNQ